MAVFSGGQGGPRVPSTNLRLKQSDWLETREIGLNPRELDGWRPPKDDGEKKKKQGRREGGVVIFIPFVLTLEQEGLHPPMTNLPTCLMNLYFRAMRPPVFCRGVYSEAANGGRRADLFVPSSQTLQPGTYHMFAGVPSDFAVQASRRPVDTESVQDVGPPKRVAGRFHPTACDKPAGEMGKRSPGRGGGILKRGCSSAGFRCEVVCNTVSVEVISCGPRSICVNVKSGLDTRCHSKGLEAVVPLSYRIAYRRIEVSLSHSNAATYTPTRAKHPRCDPALRDPGAAATAASASSCCRRIIGGWVTRGRRSEARSGRPVRIQDFTCAVNGIPVNLYISVAFLMGNRAMSS
ncbi:hypothetical protein EYF80_005948 [Liparis tanakae]|uniref:Uncharacterized protein n=1 Tax=Liparis tanakae TaxID=230148 RepID=A0A4Z2J2Q5_9TELE|nr:hypothetical protein EYF80_005948 [Liparis tanakae]